MSKKQTWILILLLLDGLIFSSMILFQFSLNNGFEFMGWKLSLLPIPLFDYAHISSNEIFLTSTILGYFFLLGFGLMTISIINDDKRKRFLTFGFIILTLYSIYFEGSGIFQEMNGEYYGQYLRNGPVLFIFGLLLMYRKK